MAWVGLITALLGAVGAGLGWYSIYRLRKFDKVIEAVNKIQQLQIEGFAQLNSGKTNEERDDALDKLSTAINSILNSIK